MAVYFAPRNNYNAWLGGGGRTGILDILGQGLLQPMLMREMAAKNYQYEDRLRAAEAERAAAESQRGRDFETAKIESERSYRDKNREGFMGGVRSMPGYVPGSDAVYGYATDVGYNGNVSDLTGALMPKQEQVSTGDKLISRTMYPDGTAGGSTSFNVGLSPKDAGTLELARRNAAINEWATRQGVAQKWQALQPQAEGPYADMMRRAEIAAKIASVYGNLQPKGGGGNSLLGDMAGGAPGQAAPGAGAELLPIISALLSVGQQQGPTFEDYQNAYGDMGPVADYGGGLSALNTGGAPQLSAPASPGSVGVKKSITLPKLGQFARDNNISIAQALEEAKKQNIGLISPPQR